MLLLVCFVCSSPHAFLAGLNLLMLTTSVRHAFAIQELHFYGHAGSEGNCESHVESSRRASTRNCTTERGGLDRGGSGKLRWGSFLRREIVENPTKQQRQVALSNTASKNHMIICRWGFWSLLLKLLFCFPLFFLLSLLFFPR